MPTLEIPRAIAIRGLKWFAKSVPLKRSTRLFFDKREADTQIQIHDCTDGRVQLGVLPIFLGSYLSWSKCQIIPLTRRKAQLVIVGNAGIFHPASTIQQVHMYEKTLRLPVRFPQWSNDSVKKSGTWYNISYQCEGLSKHMMIQACTAATAELNVSTAPRSEPQANLAVLS